MIKFIKETDYDKNKTVLNVSAFKNADIIFDKDIIKGNPLITGSRNTGKTDKVLIPLFNMSKGGVLYIDHNGQAQERIIESTDRTVHIFYNKDVNVNKIINLLLDGKIVYFNIRDNKLQDLENLNIILNGIYSSRKTLINNLVIFIDDFQFIGRLDIISKLYKKSYKYNINIVACVHYTRQLKQLYSNEEVTIIKENSTEYDVEKQHYN